LGCWATEKLDRFGSFIAKVHTVRVNGNYEEENQLFGIILCFVDRTSLYNVVNKANLLHNLFLVCLLLFSTCFGRLCAHLQEKQLCLLDDCLVCRSICSCIPDSHPHRITSTKCCINTVVSPDYGHIVARSMYRKEMNILRKIVHQVGFIYKIFYIVFL